MFALEHIMFSDPHIRQKLRHNSLYWWRHSPRRILGRNPVQPSLDYSFANGSRASGFCFNIELDLRVFAVSSMASLHDIFQYMSCTGTYDDEQADQNEVRASFKSSTHNNALVHSIIPLNLSIACWFCYNLIFRSRACWSVLVVADAVVLLSAENLDTCCSMTN